MCRNGCGTMIHFEKTNGKWLALEGGGSRHDCPNYQKRPQQQYQQQQQQQQQSPSRDDYHGGGSTGISYGTGLEDIPGMPRQKVIQLPEKNWINLMEQIKGIHEELRLMNNSLHKKFFQSTEREYDEEP